MDQVRALFNSPDPETLKLKAEDDFFERKTASTSPRDLGERISGFANSNPEGGLIGIGLSNDFEILGIKCVGQRKIDELESAPRVFTPQAIVDCKLVPCKNEDGIEDFILLLYVHYSPNRVVKDCRGRAFKRTGTRTLEMSQAEIRQMEIDKRETDFEIEIANGATLSDLNSDFIEDYIKNIIEQDKLAIKPEVEQTLVNKELATRVDGGLKITNSGVLLFAREPQRWFPGAKIRFLKYEGTSQKTGQALNITKDKTFVGTIIEQQLFGIAKTMDEQIREFSQLDENGRFKMTPEYPRFCWYEAIVNALVHRSYALKEQNIFVKLFDDHLEIQSPGNFPGIVTPENIYSQHFPRNPRLMEGFRVLGIVKAASEGVDRMRELMRESKLPDPVFINEKSHYQVIVKLCNKVEERSVMDREITLEKLISSEKLRFLSPQEKGIVLFMLMNGNKIQTGQVPGIIERSRLRSYQILKGLVEKDVIEKHGDRGPSVFYEFKNGVLLKRDLKDSLVNKREESDQKTLL